ncbi:MAG: hypothetical protein Q9195_002621 [Heterodermia aff. obscurata]
MSTPGGPTIKDEDCIDTGDEEEPETSDECVGAGIILEDIRVDDDAKIWDHIDVLLKQMKQDACRKIAKEWIKVVEPRKQTKFPYNGGVRKVESVTLYGDKNPGEFTAPPWWCSTQGWDAGIGCRHKEPDHQKKSGNAVLSSRLILVKHMLRKFRVAVLQESTKETNREIKPMSWIYLNEIYGLRRLQERYEDSEIDGSTIAHVRVPEMPPSSISKRGVTKSADSKTKESLEPLLPQMADIILTPSDIKGPEPESAFKSYPPRIPLDKESNELGLFNGADMAYDIPSSSLNQDGYANTSTSNNTPAFTLPENEDVMQFEYMRPFQSATKDESSLYPDFGHSSGVRNVRPWCASTDIDMQLCDSEFSRIGNAKAGNYLWNGVESASPHLDGASHGPPTKQATSFNSHHDYACESSTPSRPQERSMGNTLSNPSTMDMQTTPRPLDPASVYGHSHYRKTNLVHSTLDPRTLPFDDPLTLGSFIGDHPSQLSGPSRSSRLNGPAQQISRISTLGMSALAFLQLPAKAVQIRPLGD